MSALHDGGVHPRLFAEVAVAMLEQPEDQKLEARLVLVAKDVLGPRKPSERLFLGVRARARSIEHEDSSTNFVRAAARAAISWLGLYVRW